MATFSLPVPTSIPELALPIDFEATFSAFFVGAVASVGTLSSDYEQILRGTASKFATAALACAVGADWLITGSLVKFFRDSQNEYPKTNQLLKKLIFYSVNMGLLTSLADVVVLVLANVPWSFLNFYQLTVFEIVGNLYANSFLACLNARDMVSEELQMERRPPTFNLTASIATAASRVASSQVGCTQLNASIDFDLVTDYLCRRNNFLDLLSSLLNLANVPPSKLPVEMSEIHGNADGRFLDKNTLSAIEKFRQDDIVVAIIGTIGSGTSSFISHLGGQIQQGLDQASGDGLHPIRIQNHSEFGDRLVLIHSPEFRVGESSIERKTIQQVGHLLKTMYPGDDAKLHGLLYLYSREDTTKSYWSPFANIHYYYQICGTESLKRVRLILTSPDGGKYDKSDSKLAKTPSPAAWTNFLSKGSQVHSLSDSGKKRAHEIVSLLVRDTKEEEYENLARDYEALSQALEQTSRPGSRETLKVFKSSVIRLHTSSQDASALSTEYIRMRPILENIAAISRDRFKIRSGERILAFLLKTTPQFVDDSLRHPRGQNSASVLYYYSTTACALFHRLRLKLEVILRAVLG
ncbi:hypothetical protein D9756_008619 [Leucocoprinus leucothites]|uniref:DUF6534 domain-containing protein n=1 Tax=Leucocoprinus leucothites TaxID=201217 RepID=A0A8H5FVF9_9AGAR|nr:hypothetical protein D9756_008619 [Leucoagaricus leucothites]